MTDETLDLHDDRPQKRPVFLTVICILTFVGSGIGFLSSGFGLLATSFTEQNYRNLERAAQIQDLSGLASFEDYMFWTKVSNGVGLLVAILCIIGAVLMMQLKKTGFYLYLFGSVLSVVISALAMKVLMPAGFEGIGVVTVVLGGLISAAFVIMYAVNLKHMK